MYDNEDNASNIKSPITYRWNFYNDIPEELLTRFGPTILDVGSGYGRNQLTCKYNDLFVRANTEGRYRGVDLDIPYPTLLNIEKGVDVTGDWFPSKQYGLVLAIHFMEHIDIDQWESVFTKLKMAVEVGGYLIVMVPYRESPRIGHHKVFNIDELFMLKYFDTYESWFDICSTRMTNFGINNLLRRFVSYIYHLLRGRFEWPFGYGRKSLMMVWRNI